MAPILLIVRANMQKDEAAPTASTTASHLQAESIIHTEPVVVEHRVLHIISGGFDELREP
ncbi:hypothetical protein PM082_009610 [Marasmius tenuissimus]|nr:hypothetical protein PM082_009610 [Marasmius tenuissimus]